MTRSSLFVFMLALATFTLAATFSCTPAHAQAWTPPYCTGPNTALQYNQQGWQCAKITGEPGPTGPAGPQGPAGPPGAGVPAQPPPSQCITSNWNGTQWACVPTGYLEAK